MKLKQQAENLIQHIEASNNFGIRAAGADTGFYECGYRRDDRERS